MTRWLIPAAMVFVIVGLVTTASGSSERSSEHEVFLSIVGALALVVLVGSLIDATVRRRDK